MNSANELPETSPAGRPLLRHGEPAPWQAARGESCLSQISNHIEAHLGEIDTVFHEIASDTVHIDVHVVKPTKNFPYHRLVTSGMSDLPMSTPPGATVPQYTELMVTLPASWRVDQEALKDDTWNWPVDLLKYLARLPHKHNSWLGWGHSIANGDPPQPYAPNTSLCGAILLPSATVPDGFHSLRIDETKEIAFLAVVPLYKDEIDLSLRSGTNKLLSQLGREKCSDIIDLSRKSVAKKRFGLF